MDKNKKSKGFECRHDIVWFLLVHIESSTHFFVVQNIYMLANQY